jgi:hypothetical protein
VNEQQIEELVVVLAQLAADALSAWSKASGIPITPESVAALMPNDMPLTPPTE